MQRTASWKVIVIGAAMAGLGLIGAGTATAQVDASRNCTNQGPFTSHCQTNGSNQIYTAPNPQLGKPSGVYGPFFSQNRGIASAFR